MNFCESKSVPLNKSFFHLAVLKCVTRSSKNVHGIIYENRLCDVATFNYTLLFLSFL